MTGQERKCVEVGEQRPLPPNYHGAFKRLATLPSVSVVRGFWADRLIGLLGLGHRFVLGHVLGLVLGLVLLVVLGHVLKICVVNRLGDVLGHVFGVVLCLVLSLVHGVVNWGGHHLLLVDCVVYWHL